MKRALAVFFALALLSVSLFVATAAADPGGTPGVCTNNPGGVGNNGGHLGIVQHCVAI